jgi:hypothetical protein
MGSGYISNLAHMPMFKNSGGAKKIGRNCTAFILLVKAMQIWFGERRDEMHHSIHFSGSGKDFYCLSGQCCQLIFSAYSAELLFSVLFLKNQDPCWHTVIRVP